MLVPRISAKQAAAPCAVAVPAPSGAPSYWFVLGRLVRASSAHTAPKMLLVAFGIAVLLQRLGPAQPAWMFLFVVASFVLSFVLVAIPAQAVGAVLMAETGRQQLTLRQAMDVTYKVTLVNLISAICLLAIWFLVTKSIANYLASTLGFDDTIATIITNASVLIVGGGAFLFVMITSTLALIDVHYGGPATPKRGSDLFRRSPRRAIGAGLLASAASFVLWTIIDFVVAWPEIDVFLRVANLGILTWCFTVALFAHYRVAFGENGAD